MTISQRATLPLTRVRVLDVGAADSDGVSRLFADLGADVLKIEPPGGSPARAQGAAVAGIGVDFALHNANKRTAVLDPDHPGDRQRFHELVATADILVDSGVPGGAAAFGTSCAQCAEQHAQLVALQVSDFGTTGPYASWQATDPVLCAMSTALSRSGPTTGTPVLPPDGIASATADAQAAWAALAAYFDRLRHGRGDYIDASRWEAVVQALDPPFGSQGQAAAGRKNTADLWRGRPRNQNIYPIFDCRDGHVRICLLSPRQWHGMRGWLGEPAQFSGPEFETIAARYAAARELNAAIAELFADQTMAELVAEGQRRGVPIAAVASPTEALTSEHFRAAGALTEVELAPTVRVAAPTGPFVVDGRRAGLRHPAPSRPEPLPGTAEWVAAPVDARPTPSSAGVHPFAGLRIIDLGVIVAGGELGRLFGDLGAEVIKVESAAYPDGLRQAPPGMAMSKSWALTHRNHCSLGLDMRRPEGAELFAQLVSTADAVFANFKPGTLASLGFSYQRLRELNPRIVLAESSAFGATGPWSERMGYGPLVRAATGVTRLWTSDSDDGGFFDATTVFPDHLSARVTAIAALAALIGREHGASGAHVHIPQAETAVHALASTYLVEAARAAGLPVTESPAVHGVYPCCGDDEWCVISLRGDDDRDRLAALIGSPLPTGRGDLHDVIARWTSAQDNRAVAAACQQAGVPAAPMYRAVDVLTDPHIGRRSLFTDMDHPLFDAPMPTETRPARYRRIPPAPLRPAPVAGEHTREVCQKVLGLAPERIDRLLDDGVLFTAAPPTGQDDSTS
ncbi:CoA transferase [Mycolicibacterium thermoresistibile]